MSIFISLRESVGKQLKGRFREKVKKCANVCNVFYCLNVNICYICVRNEKKTFITNCVFYPINNEISRTNAIECLWQRACERA